MSDLNISTIAEQALELLKNKGFDAAQVQARSSAQDEVNIAHDQAALLRSNESHRLELTGLLDGRKASTDLTDLRKETILAAVATLYSNVQSAPQDDANVVSANERIAIEQGPQSADLSVLTDKVKELLEFRKQNTPRMHLEEGYCAHGYSESRLLTSLGSDLTSRIGYYTLTASGSAKEGTASSSFNYAGGSANDISSQKASEWFGIGDMLRDSERQIHSTGIAKSFVGDVVLSPNAVADILQWLQAQLGDMQLIANSSLYRKSVGELIASPLLSIRSRFDGSGLCAITADGFVAKPITLMEQGKLLTLLPSQYGSRKTGLSHVPSLGSGWLIDAGSTSRAELITGVTHGALVGRLSMGSPAPNGDFSSVIKNSFLIKDGKLDTALSEVMITGNVAQLLKDITAVSKERIDTGSSALPWVRAPNLHFS